MRANTLRLKLKYRGIEDPITAEVISEMSMQRRIYDVCAAPVVKSNPKGYMGTVFAEGQTGSGQSEMSLLVWLKRQIPCAGILLRSVNEEFIFLQARKSPRLEMHEGAV